MIHSNLSISNFRMAKKIMSRSVMVLAGVIILCYILNRLNYIYVEENDWSRILWHNYYETTENIDNLFVGSSHVHCDVDPILLDEINHMNNFNMSLPSMRLNGAYYAIKEAAEDHDLKNVYLELYYVPLTGEVGDVMSGASLAYNWELTDYMKPSVNKLEFALSMSKPDKYMETIFPFIRYREHLFDLPYIAANIEKKESSDYNNFYYREEKEDGIVEIRDKGYYYTTIQRPHTALFFERACNLQDGLMPENTEAYLRKIIAYCQGKDINIELFIAPIYATQVLSAIEYDLYDQQIAAIANEYGIPFYDFNLCRSEYLDIMHKEYFMDVGHFNNTGANIFTPFLWEVLTNDPEENRKYFCGSYEEKIYLDAPETYGMYYDYEEDVRKVTIASNRITEMEYQVAVMPDGGEKSIIQGFSANKEFVLPREEHGTLTVVSRMKAQPEQLQVIEMRY